MDGISIIIMVGATQLCSLRKKMMAGVDISKIQLQITIIITDGQQMWLNNDSNNLLRKVMMDGKGILIINPAIIITIIMGGAILIIAIIIMGGDLVGDYCMLFAYTFIIIFRVFD